MKLMTKRHRVTFDSEGEGASANAFVVHKPSGPVRFGTSDFGLYFYVAGATPSGATLAGAGQTGLDRRDVVWCHYMSWIFYETQLNFGLDPLFWGIFG